MRILHYYDRGRVECGVADARGRVLRLDTAGLPAGTARERFLALLGMDPEQRATLNDRLLCDASAAVERPERLAPAVPDPPLYIYGHGNAPTIWKRQMGRAAQWLLPRVPYLRVRPWSALGGHGDSFVVPEGGVLSSGIEFGVVLGRRARNVRLAEAAGRIAGIVGLNDGYLSGLHGEFLPAAPQSPSPVQVQAADTLYKSADRGGGIGPCVVTVEEVRQDYIRRVGTERLESMASATGKAAFLYDLLLRNYRNGVCAERAHTSALLLDAEFHIAFLSRFMTLEPGTVIGLGAAGWDGWAAQLGPQPGAVETQEYEIEDYGRFRLDFVRGGPQSERRQSPLSEQRLRCGLPAWPGAGERSTRALWIARGNYRRAAEVEGIPQPVGLAPLSYAWSAMGDAATPIVLPPHATRVECRVGLAAVVGEPIYNLSAEAALARVAGVAPMLHLVDRSLEEHLSNPTPYERRTAWQLGGSADGFCRLGPLTPMKPDRDLGGLEMRCGLADGSAARSNSAAYLEGLGRMLAMVSRTITLLPGDVLSLGPAGEPLVLPVDARLTPSARIAVSVQGVGDASWPVEDQRDPEAQRANLDDLWPDA